MTASRHQLLDDALAISERMIQFGDEGDWRAVIALETERRKLLEQAFATHVPLDEMVAERVRAILALDKQLMAKTVLARDGLATEISRASKGRKAATAYGSAGV